jgi:hypothetical protein
MARRFESTDGEFGYHEFDGERLQLRRLEHRARNLTHFKVSSFQRKLESLCLFSPAQEKRDPSFQPLAEVHPERLPCRQSKGWDDAVR